MNKFTKLFLSHFNLLIFIIISSKDGSWLLINFLWNLGFNEFVKKKNVKKCIYKFANLQFLKFFFLFDEPRKRINEIHTLSFRPSIEFF